MAEDMKPDKKQKEPLSRADYHNVIVAYVAVVLSVISLFVDVYQSFPRENIQILRAEDDGYYHFDGEKLFKNYQVTVANNSAIPVSIVEITVERDQELRIFDISTLSDILPLNMEPNHTEVIKISWDIPLSETNMQSIHDVLLQETEQGIESQIPNSDILLSSKPTLKIFNNVLSKQAYSFTSAWAGHEGLFDLFISSQEEQKEVPLSITLHTSKNNQNIFTAKDTGAPESMASESEWVVNMRAFQSVRDFFYQDAVKSEGEETP